MQCLAIHQAEAPSRGWRNAGLHYVFKFLVVEVPDGSQWIRPVIKPTTFNWRGVISTPKSFPPHEGHPPTPSPSLPQKHSIRGALHFWHSVLRFLVAEVADNSWGSMSPWSSPLHHTQKLSIHGAINCWHYVLRFLVEEVTDVAMDPHKSL